MAGQLYYSYVVIFSGPTVQRFTRAVDPYPDQIANWYSILPQCAFLVSDLNAAELAEFIRSVVPEIERLLVLDADTDRNGWLPKQAWDFLRTPRPSR